MGSQANCQCCLPLNTLHVCCVQTEELLVKRRSLLEKKIAQELDKAKEYTKAQNKRGMCFSSPGHCRAEGTADVL
jgi:hypothetical protein